VQHLNSSHISRITTKLRGEADEIASIRQYLMRADPLIWAKDSMISAMLWKEITPRICFVVNRIFRLAQGGFPDEKSDFPQREWTEHYDLRSPQLSRGL
jgi:hypothetical protein